MKIKESKILQDKRLNDLCIDKGIEFNSVNILLESVKTKKLLKRNNYHQQTISEVIEKATK